MADRVLLALLGPTSPEADRENLYGDNRGEPEGPTRSDQSPSSPAVFSLMIRLI